MIFNIKSLIFVSLIAIQFGCAPSESSKEITVNIGVPVRPKAPVNLTNNLMNLMSISLGYDCYQESIQLVAFDVALDKVIATKKVKLRSIYLDPLTPVPAITNGSQNADINSFLTRMTAPYSYLDEPLAITVPKGREIEIGILGAFYSPFNPSPANCSQRSGSLTAKSASLIGHQLVTSAVMSSGMMNLNIYTLVANPTSRYDGSLGPDYLNINSFPNKKDFIQIDGGVTSANYNITLKTAHWLEVDQGAYQIHQDLDNVAYNNIVKLYVPHMFPMRLEFEYNGITAAGCDGASYPCTAFYHVELNKNTSSLTSLNLSKDSNPSAVQAPSNPIININLNTY